ncbi:MAG: hypothetical protein V3V74_07550 [Nitrosomonadaceae bacterium]
MKFYKQSILFLTTTLLILLLTPAYAISDASALLTNPEVGAQTTITFAFKIEAQPLTPNAMIVVTFPSEFDVSNVQTSDGSAVLGIDGGIAQVQLLAPNEFGLIRDGTGSDTVDKDCRVSIKNVINPTQMGLTDTFLIRIYSPIGGGGWAVGGPANPRNPVTPTWVTNQSTLTGSANCPGVIISESISLGGKSNHSKFCLIPVSKKRTLFNHRLITVLGFMVLVLCCGIKRSKPQAQC